MELDDVLLEKGSYEGLPVDPGLHVLVVRAEGKTAVTMRVTLQAATRVLIHIPVLEDADNRLEITPNRTERQPSSTGESARSAAPT